MLRHTLKSLGPKVLASRMVRDYVHQLYTPAALGSRRITADNAAPRRARRVEGRGAQGLAARPDRARRVQRRQRRAGARARR